MKGRSSSGNVERRKKQVAHEDQRVSSLDTGKCHAIRFQHIEIFNSVCSHLCLAFSLSLQDVIRKTVEDKMKREKESKAREKKKKALSGQKLALDRFKK